ncbi:terpene synthase family protein [Streptomyces sp. NBC_01092]|uniref:terpene synthase family protein n=1 Tax=Streptomyces sp. NBC_01092 TaxID=2903748 RepID=UPI00386B0E13|nr:terpene synthase family protein [Streptomyces sp. NBC_01092]
MSSTSEVEQTAIPAQRGGVPRFHYPLPMPEVSHVPMDAAAQAQAWKESYGFPELSPEPRCFPGTVLAWCLGRFSTPESSKAVLRGLGCLGEWLFVIDDDVLDHPEARSRASEVIRLVGQIAHVVESPGYRVPKNASPLVAAVHDVMEQLRAECTPTQVARLSAGIRSFLASAVHKIHLDDPDEDEYLALRIHDIGGCAFAAMIEMCGPAPIPDEDWNAPAVQAIIECAALLCGVENDVVSYHKEKAEGQTSPNFVGVLQATRQLSFDQAVTAAIETRDRLMLLFLRLRERLMSTAEPPLQHLIERLGQFIIANTEINMCAPRYTPSAAQRFALEDVVKTPACWAPSLSITTTSPLPYPSISWWWDHC